MMIRDTTVRRENGREADLTETWALQALVWILTDKGRAERFVALTGIGPLDLRARVGEHAVLDAVLGFLEGHEPDLIECAGVLGIAPIDLVAARARLGA